MRKRRDVPPPVLRKLRAICAALPGVVEEVAWVGVRWKVRRRTFAHVLVIEEGWPPAYARAAGSDGIVLTFRAAGPLYDALGAMGPPFFLPRWGVTWGTKVVGMSLEGRVDWKNVATLLADSHALLGPKPRASATSAMRGSRATSATRATPATARRATSASPSRASPRAAPRAAPAAPGRRRTPRRAR